MALPGPQASRRGGNLFETSISALVIVVAVGFAAFVFQQTGTGHVGSYRLKVNMPDASGLVVGSEVRLAGAKIGSVAAVSLEQPSYRAVVEIAIRDDLDLPADTRASVSFSPLGGIYLTLVPGRAVRTIPKGGTISSPPPSPAPKKDQAGLTARHPA